MEKSIEEFYEKFYNPTDIIKIEKNLVYKYGIKLGVFLGILQEKEKINRYFPVPKIELLLLGLSLKEIKQVEKEAIKNGLIKKKRINILPNPYYKILYKKSN
ncbi:hypothetical protein [uncultured Fusobacterium sp.]|jgi:hypothetical protein|uniref:hypothetical protein n=1 Tax=uncultured Fusobacterium sp. TaxID=159267 RepID=UPI00265FFDD5|nr:hypothetical protein [uncultured Fusobacterium sp.]